MRYDNWFPRAKPTGSDLSDVISGEFFSDNDKPALPLVREALQNAIDAGKESKDPKSVVRVRIAHYTGDLALSAADAARWFGELRPHVNAEGNGLKEAPDVNKERCDFLVVEDFGTCGLTGDVTSDTIAGKQNNFVDFMRSDGRTRKSAGEQGSWGVGKNVFPRCSRINAFLICTNREDDRQSLVMGKCILKMRVVDQTVFSPQIYFASSWKSDEPPRPIDCQETISDLCATFRLQRNQDAGLSIVVPWTYDSLNAHQILEAVVSEYYYAILANDLCVTVELNGEPIEIAAGTIESIAEEHDSLRNYVPLIRLAKYALEQGDFDRITLTNHPPADGSQKWTPDLLTADECETIRSRLLEGQRVALRVPLHIVRSKGNEGIGPESTYFDVYLEPDETSKSVLKPAFFRERLCINEIQRASGASKIRALVTVEDKPLATLLRAAEPPNHSDWKAGTSNFKGNYVNGNHVVTFVKDSVRSIATFARSADDKPDATIAIDYFSLPEDAGEAPKPKSKPKPKENPDDSETPDPEIPPAKPKRYRISDEASGFRVGPGDDGTDPPKTLNVTMAYDVFSGSPWKLYEPADFDLTAKGRSGIDIAVGGDATATVCGPNKLQLDIHSRSFEVYVTGFDENRDLIVSARAAEEVSDGDSPDELHETD